MDSCDSFPPIVELLSQLLNVDKWRKTVMLGCYKSKNWKKHFGRWHSRHFMPEHKEELANRMTYILPYTYTCISSHNLCWCNVCKNCTLTTAWYVITYVISCQIYTVHSKASHVQWRNVWIYVCIKSAHVSEIKRWNILSFRCRHCFWASLSTENVRRSCSSSLSHCRLSAVLAVAADRWTKFCT